MNQLESERPLASVVIPCRNEADHVEACLASVLAQEKPEGGFEILVADGMSDDGTREILARLGAKMSGHSSQPPSGLAAQTPPVQSPVVSAQWSLGRSPVIWVIDNPGRIVPTGVNAAIRAARGEIIVRMDAHTHYATDYIRQCVEALHQTGADNVGGPARTQADTYMGRAIAAAYHSPFAVGGARFHDVHYEGYVDTVTYGCWRKTAFDRFGYFDEELVRNQDDEHNFRIIRGGGRIWQSPKIRSWYRPRASLPALFKQYMQYGYWKVRVIQKHKLPASWRHVVPGAFVFGLASLCLLSAFCFLLSALDVSGPRSVVRSVSYLWFLLSAFSLSTVLSTYVFGVLAASVRTALKTEWKLLLILPLVFPCYHFGYGIGFLKGVRDFLIRGQSPKAWATRVTRL